MSVGAEQQVVQARAGIVRERTVGVAVVAGGDVREIVSEVRDTHAGLVLPAFELVQVRPAGAAGTVRLGGRLFVEVVEEDDEILRRPVAGLGDGQGRVVVDDVKDHMAGPRETRVFHHGDGDRRTGHGAAAGIRIHSDPRHVTGHPPGPVGNHLDGKAGSRLRHRSLGQADLDGRKAQVGLRFLAGERQRKRGQQSQE